MPCIGIFANKVMHTMANFDNWPKHSKTFSKYLRLKKVIDDICYQMPF